MRELLASAVVPKFLNGITGHGFLKIMRADIAVGYEITKLPPVPEVLQYLADHLGMPPAEAYSTLNMGAGYVAIVRPEDADETVRVARTTGHDALVGRQHGNLTGALVHQAGSDRQNQVHSRTGHGEPSRPSR